jgi:D-alanine--D-alanine ligase
MRSVAVLAGGCSAEHDISVASALQVLAHLDRSRWQVWPVFLGRDGTWSPAPRPLTEATWPGPDFHSAGMARMRPGRALEVLMARAAIDIVLPVLHGRWGEDGTVQGMLELHGVPFVGSDTAASAAAMDKIRTRECLTYWGVPMAAAYLPTSPLAHADPVREAQAIADTIGYPCFLKTDVSGSTIGVERAERAADVERFLRAHRCSGRRFLAEAEVSGVEISVPVLGNTGAVLEPLPPVGIYPVRDRYFTYTAKYEPGMCEEIVPPRGMHAAAIAEVQDLALRCHRALQCDGLSRTDMIVGPAGPCVLEVNTLPGLTANSLLPRAARAVGLELGPLLDRLLALGIERWRGSLAGGPAARDDAIGLPSESSAAASERVTACPRSPPI